MSRQQDLHFMRRIQYGLDHQLHARRVDCRLRLFDHADTRVVWLVHGEQDAESSKRAVGHVHRVELPRILQADVLAKLQSLALTDITVLYCGYAGGDSAQEPSEAFVL